METTQERYAAKIAALLRKAESTTPEEAELLVEKAQALMAKYAIEEAMLDSARSKTEREKIVEKTIRYKSAYHHGLYAIGSAIAGANGCRCLMTRSKNLTTLYLVGFESDVDRSIMLDSSLQIQAQVAWKRAKDDLVRPYMTAMEQFKERRSFLLGFAQGVQTRLDRAAKSGREEAASERALATRTDRASVEAGMELMIRSRKDRVDDWVDQKYGRLRYTRSSIRGGSLSASAAGQAAGLSADTGSSGRVGARRQIGS